MTMPSVADTSFLYPMEEKEWAGVIHEAAQQLADEHMSNWDYLLMEAQMPWIEKKPPRERLEAYISREEAQWEMITAASPRMAEIELLDFAHLLRRWL